MKKFINVYMKVLTYEARFIIMAIVLGHFVYSKDVSWSFLGFMLVSATGMFKNASKMQGEILNSLCIAALLAMYWMFGKCYFGL